ncbi:MAG: phosphopantothenoylcysteine decarboxylase [Kiritimatiellae bacterium]|nr:phosphopantothenoylcysteine decarboxylase [Kiritimatiellia bacterium]
MNFVVGVTGSIAAYKACELVREFIKAGHEVRVVMTKSACEFVTPLTFRTLSKNPVAVTLFNQEQENWMPAHIELANFADAFVIAPCTANVLAKLANGIADDALTATYLANKAPVLIAPSMNVNMWENAATQANVATLESRGVHFIDPDSGDLACGVNAKGKLPSPAIIAATAIAIAQKYKESK